MFGEFESEAGLDAAARAAQEVGFARIDAFGPYPLAAIAERVGLAGWIVPTIAVVAGIAGVAGTYYMQYWMNAVDYPLNVGGRPLHSWPAFIPASIIVGVLAAGTATLLGMLVLCGLPRLDHPAFDVPGFERASQDRFFLMIEREGDAFDLEKARAALATGRPIAVHEVSS